MRLKYRFLLAFQATNALRYTTLGKSGGGAEGAIPA